MIKEMEDAADAEIMKGPKQKTGNEEGKENIFEPSFQ